jgi:predicted dehydrogenase/nucleoside-diphosphate-sugar epimerase
VGTGYIADFHARALRTTDGVELIAVCDAKLKSAESFAANWSVPNYYSSLEAMLQSVDLDCVHLLVPPDLHHSLAKTALNLGVHVLIEKPMCTSVAQADELVALSETNKLKLGVSHNFMFTPAYEQLRDVVKSGTIGPIDQITFHHLFELPQLRFGPFEAWMVREPGNVILETGPHLISILLDLVGNPEQLAVKADRMVALPGESEVFRRWRVQAEAGRTAISMNINFGPGFPQRTIFVRGLFGSALVDLDANTCIIDQRTPADIDLDRYSRTRHIARQLRGQGWDTLMDYVLGKFSLRKRGNPYQNSIIDSVATFYKSLHQKLPLDIRIDAKRARDIIDCCTRMIASAGIPARPAPQPAPVIPLRGQPTVLVLGAGGFIGRALVRQLLAAGYCVRAMVRGSTLALTDLKCDRLEFVRGDIRNKEDLLSSMSGIEFVYHLAHAQAKTWDEYQRNDIDPARLVGEACLIAKVKRLVYTGTIASYYTGPGAATITEATPLDPKIMSRDYYARAKAASEDLLVQMHQKDQLPLVIFRPGIVVGQDGNPFHWGVGRFSENICEVWGDGTHKLPFVLVTDVAAALVRGIQVPGIEGRSYNLIDVPLLSARDYIDELQSLATLKFKVLYRPIWQFYISDLTKWIVKVIVKHPDRIRFPSYSDWAARRQMAIFNCAKARAELDWSPAGDEVRMRREGIGSPLKYWLSALE